MGDELVIIATFGNSIEANMAKGALQAEGIHAAVAGEDPGGMLALMTSSIGIKLYVRREDLKAATKVLDEHERTMPTDDESASDDPWDEEQDPEGQHEAFAEEASRNEEQSELNAREQRANRAFRSAILGIFFCPLQAYTFWLLAKVCFSDERLAPAQRRWAWIAAAIVFPYVVVFLWIVKFILTS